MTGRLLKCLESVAKAPEVGRDVPGGAGRGRAGQGGAGADAARAAAAANNFLSTV